jgi:hypothetical protein
MLNPGKKCPDRKQDFWPGHGGSKDKDFVLLPEAVGSKTKHSSTEFNMSSCVKVL